MARRYPRVTRGSMDDHSEELMKVASKVRNGINEKVDGYLDGTYDPGDKARKSVLKGITTAAVLMSLLAGSAFSGPADILDEQEAVNYRPAPVVMDVDEFVNAPVEDDDDDADEEKSVKLGAVARFRQAVMQLPQSVRLLIITPLWALGTAIMTSITFLWNILFASPLGAFIASFAFGFAILTGLFTVTAKMLFPDIPLRKILSGRNVLILGCLAMLLSVIDAVAPMYWHQYPLAAALVKLVLGGTVIGFLAQRTHKLLGKLNIKGLPPAAA